MSTLTSCKGTFLRIPAYNHKRLHQCFIMEICWDSFLFHFALSSPLSSAFSSHLCLALLFMGVLSVATPSDIIFAFHHFLITSLSLPYQCFSCPLSFVSYFSLGQHTESCSSMSFLERKADSGLLGAEHVLPEFTDKEREKELKTLIHGPLSLLFSHFLLPITKIDTRRIRSESVQKFYLVTKAQLQIFLAWSDFLHCSAPWSLWSFQTWCHFLVVPDSAQKFITQW